MRRTGAMLACVLLLAGCGPFRDDADRQPPSAVASALPDDEPSATAAPTQDPTTPQPAPDPSPSPSPRATPDPTPAPTPSPTPTELYDVVRGDVTYQGQSILLDARTPTGLTEAEGTWYYANADGFWAGDVARLEVTTAYALACGTILEASTQEPIGQPFSQFVDVTAATADGTGGASRSYVGEFLCTAQDPPDLAGEGLPVEGVWSIRLGVPD